jgi:hypothetical protein
MFAVLKLFAFVGAIAVLLLTTPFVVFRAHNQDWMPFVVGGIALLCMLALLPGRRRSKG